MPVYQVDANNVVELVWRDVNTISEWKAKYGGDVTNLREGNANPGDIVDANGNVVDNVDNQNINEVRTEAMKIISQAINDLISSITDQYPESDRLSWSAKMNEANAIVAGTVTDPATQTPIIHADAVELGIPITDITTGALTAEFVNHAQLIITKSTQFNSIRAKTMKIRNTAGGAIWAATTVNDVKIAIDTALNEIDALSALI